MIGTGRFIVITGAQAAGKTTVGRELAGRLRRAVHVDGDAIQRFVVTGAVPMDLPAPPEALRQLHLRYAGAFAVCQVYLAAGFDAVFTDNIFQDDLVRFLEQVPAEQPVYTVVLDPDLEIIRSRYAARPGGGYTESITPEILKQAVDDTPRIGLRLDTGGQSAAESAREILDRLAEAEVRNPVAGR